MPSPRPPLLVLHSSPLLPMLLSESLLDSLSLVLSVTELPTVREPLMELINRPLPTRLTLSMVTL